MTLGRQSFFGKIQIVLQEMHLVFISGEVVVKLLLGRTALCFAWELEGAKQAAHGLVRCRCLRGGCQQ